MTEQRKHAILFAATLSARRLIENIESDKPHMNEQYFIDRTNRQSSPSVGAD